MSSLEDKKAKLRVLRKKEKLRQLRAQAAQDQPLPQMIPGEEMSPEHQLMAQDNTASGQISQFSEAMRPKIPIVGELAEMAGQAVSGAISGEGFDKAREVDEAAQVRADQRHPGAAMIGDVSGAAVLPGGVLAGAGTVGVDTALQGGSAGDVAKNTALALGTGGLIKGISKVAPKVLGKGKTKAAQDKKIDDFIEPTSAQRSAPEYRANTDRMVDEVMVPQKAVQKKIKRDELNELMVTDVEKSANRLGELRKGEVGLTRKDLQTNLKLKSKQSDTNMDSVGRADFAKASSQALPKEYHALAKQVKASTKVGEVSKKKIDHLSKKLATAKSNAIGLEPKITVKGKSINNPKFVKSDLTVRSIEKQIAAEQKALAEGAEELRVATSKMTEIEEGRVTLDQLYNQKKNLKRKDFAGEAELELRRMEDSLGGEELAAAKKAYGAGKETQKITQASIGKFANQSSPSANVPLGKINQTVKAIKTILPKHKEALKLSGISPTSKLLQNDKFRKVITDGVDRHGAKGVAVVHKTMMSRDEEYRKIYNEEQKKKAEEENE